MNRKIRKTAALHNLGCKVNAYETEAMQQMLEEAGYEIVDFNEKADIYVVNTCSVTNMADRKSRQMLHRAKKKNPNSIVIAAGCYAQTKTNEARLDESVDILIGNNQKQNLIEAVYAYEKNKKQTESIVNINDKQPYETLSVNRTAEHTRAFIKVQDGCNQFCSYCIIPKIRGAYRSVPIEELLQQAKRLVSQGVKEIILVAQETTLYGVDLYGKKTLAKLLDGLNQIKGLVWIRILYCYPEEIDDELIEAIVRNKKVCHYLDIPIQHSSDIILKRMGRKTNHADLAAMIQKLREKIPDICLRTTLICGFPGETDETHEELMQFVNDMEFDRLGAFVYSPEEGTLAETFQNQIEEEQKLCWQEQVMELQQEISFDKNEDLKGKEFLVFVEGKVADENVYLGRTYRDAPEVDGYVFIHTSEMLMTGDFVKVKITGAYEYDLIGELIP